MCKGYIRGARRGKSPPYERKRGTWRLLERPQEKGKIRRGPEAWRLIRVRGNEHGQRDYSLFQEGAVLEQYIPFGDGLGDARGHQYGSATQDNDLIGVKTCQRSITVVLFFPAPMVRFLSLV